MVLASIVFTADMRDLLVLGHTVVFSSLIIVIDVVVLVIRVLIVLVILGNLEHYVTLLFKVIVVWINKHIFVIIGNIVKLLNLLLVIASFVNHYYFFLNQELWVLMLVEWVEHIDIQVFVLLVLFKFTLLFFLESLLL